MKRPALAAFPLLFLVFLQPSSAGSSLTLQERIQAQRVIDHLRYGHQVGATKSFDKAVPPSATERKVLASLKESVALETWWGSPITEEALRQEMERIESRTLDPARLRELYAALGNDEQLILEMVARPSLVERLTRNFYAYDERIHAKTRKEARQLEAGLRTGAIDPRSQSPWRSVVTLNPEDAGDAEAVSTSLESSSGSSGFQTSDGDVFSSAQLQKLQPGTIIAPEEKRDSFVMQTVLPSESGSTKVISYTVPKRSWESWWREVGGRFPLSQARTVAGRSGFTREPTEKAGVVSHWQPTTALATCHPDDTWNTTPFESLPASLSGHKAVWTGTEMVVWGDKRTGGFRYNPLTDTWRPMSTVGAPEANPDPFAVAPWFNDALLTTVVWSGSEMIYWDGFQVTGGRYDPETDTWRPMSTEGAPSWRTAYVAVWTGTEMIVWGGRGPVSRHNDGARYDPSTDSWRPMSQTGAPAARSGPAALWTGDKMIVWGGFPSPQADGGALYNPVTDSWTPMSTVGSLPGGLWPPAVWAGDQMIVVSSSGSSGSRRYVPATNTWLTMATYEEDGFSIRATSRTWTGKELIIWDGLGTAGARYDPIVDRWSPMQFLNAPSDRHLETVVWTGELVILWGGDAGSSGGRYNPETDSWTPTATSSGPEERQDHNALWTGNEMIIWRGQTGAFRQITGGARFDVLTGQWRDLPKEGAPSDGEILWTGEEMLAWGGPGIGGGLFNPITNSWRPMSTTNAPPQEQTEIAWTGSEAILWGGFSEPYANDDDDDFFPVYSSEGGIYDPALDTWRPTSTTGAPEPRANHALLWTGEELIAWGGARCPDRCTTNLGGARYNPFTDSWLAMNHVDGRTSNPIWTGQEAYFLFPGRELAYEPVNDTWSLINRANFSWAAPVLWTGEEVIVGGGNTGGRYSPATRKWVQLSSIGNPYPRGGESGVWTGNSMIIWGGTASAPAGTLTKTGGIYYLAVDQDRDGFTSCQGDCNDTDPAIGPGHQELPGDFVDENCDGVMACPPLISGRNGLRQFMQCMSTTCGRIVRRDGTGSQDCMRRAIKALQASQCGDGRLRRPEACDGSSLAEMTCEALGFTGGTLACNDTCDGFDTSGCTQLCGDGLVSGHERCDGINMSGETCASQGFYDGELACSLSCRNFDTSSCLTSCGDGFAHGLEACDGADFRGKTCTSYGFDAGTLSCSATCDRIELDSCTAVCGDGVRRGSELCDGTDGLEGLSCRALNGVYQGGEISCATSCNSINLTKCVRCGDGKRAAPEECDGADLAGQTCQSLGHMGGTLRCSTACGFIFTDCIAN